MFGYNVIIKIIVFCDRYAYVDTCRRSTMNHLQEECSMNMKKWIAAGLTAGMLLTAAPVLAEEAPVEETPVEAVAVVDTQRLDASYTLALNAINA